MAASLTSLPVELLTYILMNLQSPRDLYHTIQASSTCYRVFQVYRVSIFSRILSNFFHRDVTQDALCALYASRTLNLPNVAPLQLREMLATFLREYHSGTLAFPGNFEDLSSLGRAWARVDAFVLDYITGSSVVQARQLRATGDTRLRKAFFRLAIFYSCSWVDRRVCDFLDMGFHRNGRMNELFFGPMSWTEISCMYTAYNEYLPRHKAFIQPYALANYCTYLYSNRQPTVESHTYPPHLGISR